MILGIGAEVGIFFYALLAGIEVAAFYYVLICLRKLVRHKVWAVNLEDLIYWLGASVYIFQKMYDTTYGGIRWFFVLGILCGAAVFCKLAAAIVKRCFKRWKEKENDGRLGRKVEKENRK